MLVPPRIPTGGASIAANLSNVRFLEHTIREEHPSGASIAANLSSVLFLKHPVREGHPSGASIAANLSNVRFLKHPVREDHPSGASIAANLLKALKMARDGRMGKMGCNPAFFLSRSTRTLPGCSSEQGDLANCRNPTSAHKSAPNQPRRGPLTSKHFFD